MRKQATAVLAVGIFCFAAGGCTSSGDSSTLSALVPESSSPDAPGASSSTPLPSPAPGSEGISSTAPASQVASAPAGTRIAFATVMGAPDTAIAPLSRELSARARLRGIVVTPAGNPGGSYVLKGYFSTMDEGSAGSVVYVWDVVDAAGKRLYRIQGRERLADDGGWNAVTDSTMQAIADRTIDQLATWLSQPPG